MIFFGMWLIKNLQQDTSYMIKKQGYLALQLE